MLWMAAQAILSFLTWCFILFTTPLIVYLIVKLIERLKDAPMPRKEKRREIDLH